MSSSDHYCRSLLSGRDTKGKRGAGESEVLSLSFLMTPLGREDWYKCYSRERLIRVMEVVRWVLSYTFYMLFPGNNSCDIKSSSISVLSPSFPQEYGIKVDSCSHTLTSCLKKSSLPLSLSDALFSSSPFSMCIFDRP